MKSTIVGVYDNHEQARMATDALIAAGFSRDALGMAPYAEEQYPGQRIDGDQISYSGVETLFGIDADRARHDANSEAVGSGNYVVTITAGAEDTGRITDIMSRFNPVDIQEHAPHREQHGRSRFDENTPEFSQREIEQERTASSQSRMATTESASPPIIEEQLSSADSTRRMDAEMEQLQQPNDASTTARDFDDADFRRHWQSAYGQTGGQYEDYDSAYRYGSTAAGSDRYRNYQWSEVEPDLRNDWEAVHPESTWEKVKDAVRYGAEHMRARRPN
jgi:hypothetical protein